MSTDHLTSRALQTAAALLNAAAAGDREAMRTLLAATVPYVVAPETVVTLARDAAVIFDATPDQVLGRAQHREALDARHVTCYAAHLLGLSYSHIGRQIGRDHTSVMNGVGRVGESPRLRSIAERLAADLGWDREVRAS